MTTATKKPTAAIDPVCEQIRNLIIPFVTLPNDLTVTGETLGRMQSVIVRCNIEDYGRIVGKGGSIVRGLKVITQALGFRQGRKAELSVPFMEKRDVLKWDFEIDPHWTSKEVERIMGELCKGMFFKPVHVTAHNGTELTNLELILDVAETMVKYVPKLDESLTVIFNTIGKTQGRNEIIVNIIKD